MKYLMFILFLATIPAANWMIGNVGTFCVPNGPCLVPVGFGLSAPSGVLLIGAAFVLRDAVQQMLGLKWAFAAIVIGVLLSVVFSPPSLVLASAVAFAVAEFLDLAVYTPLRQRNLGAAVFVSGCLGAVADSVVFLWLAFGSLDFVAGQVLGKIWLSLFAVLVIFTVQWILPFRGVQK